MTYYEHLLLIKNIYMTQMKILKTHYEHSDDSDENSYDSLWTFRWLKWKFLWLRWLIWRVLTYMYDSYNQMAHTNTQITHIRRLTWAALPSRLAKLWRRPKPRWPKNDWRHPSEVWTKPEKSIKWGLYDSEQYNREDCKIKCNLFTRLRIEKWCTIWNYNF